MSPLGLFYDRVYEWLCGTHPKLRFWHFQWLMEKRLSDDLKQLLPLLHGKILDVGCGQKPYEHWLGLGAKGLPVQVTGLDVTRDSAADIVVDGHTSWPLPNDDFDAVICLQVIEHARDLPILLSEVQRVLKPGGELVVSLPHITNEHGAPDDYRRLTKFGTEQLFQGCEVLEVRLEGGIGTSLGMLCLNWVETELNHHLITRFLKGVLLPIWIVFCAGVNAAAWTIDHLDSTGMFYTNVLVHLKKASRK